jgi:chromosome segregation ATPase
MKSQAHRTMSPQSQSSKEIKSMLISLLQLKKTNSSKSKELLHKITEISTKEKLIHSLKKELKYHQTLNSKYNLLYQTTLSQRIETEKNWNKVKQAYNKQRFKMKDYFLYTSTIDSRKEQIRSNFDVIIVHNEKKIENKFQEKSSLNLKLKETEDKLSKQKSHIISLEQMIKSNTNRKAAEFREYVSTEKNDLNKIDKLSIEIAIEDKKLKDLINKIYSNVIQVSNIDDDYDFKHNELFNEDKQIEELKITLADKQIQHEHLMKQVNTLKDKIENLKAKQHEMELEQQYYSSYQKVLTTSNNTRNYNSIVTNGNDDYKYQTLNTQKSSQRNLGRNISSFTFASTNKTSTINSTTRIMSRRNIVYSPITLRNYK